jgi:hypothetical protein
VVLTSCLHVSGMDTRRGNLKRRLELGESASSSALPSSSSSRSIRRRIERGDVLTSESPTTRPLPFNHCMRRDWAKGQLPSNKVLEYSAAASKQGAQGTFRVRETWHTKTAHRDLVAALGWPEDAPDIKWIDIPKGPNKTMTPHPVVCPVETFAKLYSKRRDLWNKRIRGDAGACKAYWESLESHPIVSKHPILRKDNFENTIALGLHGDGAPLTKHESLFTIAWNSLHATGTTMQTCFVFSCITQIEMCEGTMEALWDYFAWAMNVLQTGLTPHRDWRDRRLP